MCHKCILIELKIKTYYKRLNIRIYTINYLILPKYNKICFKNNQIRLYNFIMNYDILSDKCKIEMINYISSKYFSN